MKYTYDVYLYVVDVQGVHLLRQVFDRVSWLHLSSQFVYRPLDLSKRWNAIEKGIDLNGISLFAVDEKIFWTSFKFSIMLVLH